MANLQNLNEDNLKELRKAFEERIKPFNEEATLEPFKMAQLKDELQKGKDQNENIKELSDRLESLENLIKNIFDGHVLINGQFIKI